MTTEEIFSELTAHIVKGLMFHDQMNSYYSFLGLKKYACAQRCRYADESKTYFAVKEYYFNHHNKLIKEKEIESPSVIPKSWYNYGQKDVDINTKRNAVKSGLEKWIVWEKETKILYQTLYKEAMNLGEVTDMRFIENLICDVDEELLFAQTKYLDKSMLDFSIGSIMEDQKEEK